MRQMEVQPSVRLQMQPKTPQPTVAGPTIARDFSRRNYEI